MASKLAGAIEGMWLDVDRCFADLSEADATTQHGGGSSFAWTLLHIAGFEDGNLNVRVRGMERHPVLLDQFTRFRDTGGASDNWAEVQRGVAELHAEVQTWLDGFSEEQIASMMAPATARQAEVPLVSILWRDIAHAYYHIGEVAAKRDQMGQRTGDYPSMWEHSV